MPIRLFVDSASTPIFVANFCGVAFHILLRRLSPSAFWNLRIRESAPAIPRQPISQPGSLATRATGQGALLECIDLGLCGITKCTLGARRRVLLFFAVYRVLRHKHGRVVSTRGTAFFSTRLGAFVHSWQTFVHSCAGVSDR